MFVLVGQIDEVGNFFEYLVQGSRFIRDLLHPYIVIGKDNSRHRSYFCATAGTASAAFAVNAAMSSLSIRASQGASGRVGSCFLWRGARS